MQLSVDIVPESTQSRAGSRVKSRHQRHCDNNHPSVVAVVVFFRVRFSASSFNQTLAMLDKAHKSAGRVLLPSYAVPTKYDLKITPDLVNFTFEGLVKIEFTTSDVADKEQQITLHSKELLFRSASFTTSEGKSVSAEEVRIQSIQCVF